MTTDFFGNGSLCYTNPNLTLMKNRPFNICTSFGPLFLMIVFSIVVIASSPHVISRKTGVDMKNEKK